MVSVIQVCANFPYHLFCKDPSGFGLLSCGPWERL